jgi:hypothetical protein
VLVADGDAVELAVEPGVAGAGCFGAGADDEAGLERARALAGEQAGDQGAAGVGDEVVQAMLGQTVPRGRGG